MIATLTKKLKQMILIERSPRKAALSFALGVFIAFSPFVGFHTAMVFLFAWLFALNAALLFAVSILLNNPWTMVPIYATGHVVGDHIFYWLGIDAMYMNPSWVSSINNFITRHTGMSGISFWAFMIGGHLLGLLLSIVVYFVVHHIVSQRMGSLG